MKIQSRRVVARAVFLCVLLGLFAVLLRVLFGDEGPHADGDLAAPPRPVVAPDDNAFVALRDLAKGLPETWDEIGFTSNWRWDEGVQESRELVARRETTLAGVRRALSRECYDSGSRSFETSEELGVDVRLVRLLRIRFRLAIRDGDLPTAAATVLDALRLVSLPLLQPESVGERLRFAALAVVVLADVALMLESSGWREEDLAPLVSQIELLTADGDRGFVLAALRDHQLMVDFVDRVASGDADLRRLAVARSIQVSSLKPRRTRRKLAQRYRRCIEWADLTYRQYRERATESPVCDGWVERIQRQIGGTAAGDAVLRERFEERAIFRAEMRYRAALALVRTLLAMEAFRRDEARQPDDLSELVPSWLREIPRDPYDGEPLRYDFDRSRIYSVGEDLEDNGEAKEGLRASDPNLWVRTY